MGTCLLPSVPIGQDGPGSAARSPEKYFRGRRFPTTSPLHPGRHQAGVNTTYVRYVSGIDVCLISFPGCDVIMRPAHSKKLDDRVTYWWRGIVVSGVRRMNEVNARRARLVPGWVTRLRAGIPSRYVTSQLDQLNRASLRGRLIEYQLRLG